MKSATDIVRCVTQRIDECLERPRSYAPNAVALEEVLIILDAIEQYARGEEDLTDTLHNAKYAEFLRKKGFGVNTIALSRLNGNENCDEGEAIREVVDLWREYRRQRRCGVGTSQEDRGD